MKLSEVAALLNLKPLVEADLTRTVTGGYACDLLSCVMAKARAGNIWITIQSHPNIVAVASLLDLAGVIITEASPVEPATVAKAATEKIPLFETPLSTYAVVARLAQAGLMDTGE